VLTACSASRQQQQRLCPQQWQAAPNAAWQHQQKEEQHRLK
jgi:hypothetical protein